ncbi:hypothetical protein ACA544_02140 [Vibrio cholerae]|uniref:hypothetical protein n=1 Tax=Vibrio cholerae TaxID=666 RepID=UPI0011D620DB|nr:hypothetical protein [Vibrio cholerae]TXY78134.1 hypothetical protein FXE80_01880 [Vibrio cholerae]GIB17419.1 hypothetical protein VCSRO90_2982 [Vibrio cholerae]
MTNEEFCRTIIKWKETCEKNELRMPDGSLIPEDFWAFFIGYKYSSYRKMKGEERDKRPIKPYTSKLIRLLNEMPEKKFVDEVKFELGNYSRVLK